VALVARSAVQLKELADELGGTAHPADLTDLDDLLGLVARVEDEAGGPVDVLVNNAGIEAAAGILDAEHDPLASLLQLNLATPVELCRQAARLMAARGGGHIVNVSSMASAVAFPGLATYAASKAGLSQFSRLLARELSTTGVHVTLVELGPIPTDMLDSVMSHEPARLGFERGYKLRLIVDVPKERVAVAMADAIEKRRFNVVLPKRAAAFPLVAGLPQRVNELLSRGLPTR
jgi:uncharacterized protein